MTMLTPPSQPNPANPAPAGSGAPPSTPPGQSSATNPPAGNPPAGSPPGEGAAERPAWLPEKYKTVEDFRKGYDNVNALVGKSRDEIRDSLRAELEGQSFKDRPEAADKYALPEFKENPNVDVEALGKHELVGWWREQAFKRGLSNDEFQAGIAQYVNAMAANLPDPEKERKALGENAAARIEQVSLWVQQTFPDPADFQAVAEIGVSAKGIEILEKLMAKTKIASGIDAQPGGTGQSKPEGDTEEKIKDLMASKEYYHPVHRKAEVVKRVEDFFAKKYAQG